jgi:hypothetical protein
MDKIYLKDNYIVTELGGITTVFGKNYTVYSENTTTFFLNSSFPINNARSVTIDFSRSSSIYNEAGTVAYTTATLRSFFLTNTGFKSPSGGSGGVWGSITGTLSSQTDLQNALDAKQDDLVSGTNIKTLEGQSLLGAGNIDLTKSDVGLSNVDNTSDLNKPISTLTQTALNAKQNTLTLTTTGTSGAATLVGSTLNIPQYGGGGGGLVGLTNIYSNFPVSTFGIDASLNALNIANTSITANNINLYPFTPNKTITSTQLRMNVTTLGAGLSRILIYSDLNGFPNTKLYESTDINVSTLGVKSITTSFAFNAGTTYWLGYYTNIAHNITGINPGALVSLMVNNVASSPAIGYARTTTFGTAPTNFTYGGLITASVPRIMIIP